MSYLAVKLNQKRIEIEQQTITDNINKLLSDIDKWPISTTKRQYKVTNPAILEAIIFGLRKEGMICNIIYETYGPFNKRIPTFLRVSLPSIMDDTLVF